jgi:hypothetical protein
LRIVFGLAIALIVASTAMPAVGGPVTLQNGTATFSQSSFSVDEAIDGSLDGSLAGLNGWAIDPNEIGQTAAFETAVDVGGPGSTLLTFTLHQLFAPNSNGHHTIGRFRLSATTDDRSLFADGADIAGDVTANWVVLSPLSATSAFGATLATQGDNSILASGTSPEIDTYTVTALTTLAGITGFRLEVLEDASLPKSGPGRQPTNGNFVLTEFQVDATAVPEPGSLALLGIGGVGLAGRAIRKRRKMTAV